MMPHSFHGLQSTFLRPIQSFAFGIVSRFEFRGLASRDRWPRAGPEGRRAADPAQCPSRGPRHPHTASRMGDPASLAAAPAPRVLATKRATKFIIYPTNAEQLRTWW